MHNPTTTTTTSTPQRRWVTLLLVASFSALLSLPWMERPFHTRGEPREALVAQAMLSHSNWISPPAYDGSVPSKPPFLHWLIASAGSLSGSVSELTARLPSSLAVVLFSVAFALVIQPRSVSNHASTLATVLILLASSEWFRSASTCRVDMLLATSAAGALLALFKWWELKPEAWCVGGVNQGKSGPPSRNLSPYWIICALILCAAATLTKGPVGVVITLAPFSLFVWGEAGFRFKAFIRVAFRSALISLVALLVASIWYILGYIERGAAFIEKVRYENFERFTSQMADEPHKHSSLYLIAMLALGLLPWTIVLFSSALRWLREINISRDSKGALKRLRELSGVIYSNYRKLAPLERFSCIVVLFTVLFFCVPSSKRSVYLLPCYPFAAILLERSFRLVASERRFRRWCNLLSWVVLAFSAVSVVSVLVLYVVFYLYSDLKFGGYFRLDYREFILSISTFKVVVLGIIAAIIFSPLCLGEVRALWGRPIERLGLAVISAVVVCSFFIYDPVAWQLSPKGWVLSDERIRGARYYSYGVEAYAASFYLGEQFSGITLGFSDEGGGGRNRGGGDKRLMIQGREVGLRELSGGVVFLEARRESEFREALARVGGLGEGGAFGEAGGSGARYEVLVRHSSGVERAGRDVLVVRVLGGG